LKILAASREKSSIPYLYFGYFFRSLTAPLAGGAHTGIQLYFEDKDASRQVLDIEETMMGENGSMSKLPSSVKIINALLRKGFIFITRCGNLQSPSIYCCEFNLQHRDLFNNRLDKPPLTIIANEIPNKKSFAILYFSLTNSYHFLSQIIYLT